MPSRCYEMVSPSLAPEIFSGHLLIFELGEKKVKLTTAMAHHQLKL